MSKETILSLVNLSNTISELKRLQKEIDVANKWRDSAEGMFFSSDEDWDKRYDTIKTNQQKIKEIIESL